jgi:cell division protein FtsL
MATAARAVSTAARALPAREPAREPASSRPRPRLDVVDRRRAGSRSSHRKANTLRGLGVMFVVGALAVTAAAHTFVASDQQRIDTLQSQLTQALAEQQDLQLSRAELESPVRVLAIAERQLGMISPESVSYLPPADPGPSVSQAGADAARTALSAAAARKAGPPKSAKSAKTDALGARKRTRTSPAGARSSAITPPTG